MQQERAAAKVQATARHAVSSALLTCLLVAGSGFPAWSQSSLAPPAGTADADVMPEGRAQLTPRQYTTLSSELSGRIDAIGKRLGETFKQGEVLVTFDCAVQRAQLARGKAIVTQTEKTLAINQRLQQLHSIGQLEVDVAHAEVEKAKADFTVAEAMVSKCVIAAPFDGIVVEQKAQPFQYATPGQALLDIVSNQSLEVELIMPSRWLAWLTPGYPFQIQVDETGKTYPTKILRVSGRVDPVSQSIKVVAGVTTPAPELMAGMSGKIIIHPPK